MLLPAGAAGYLLGSLPMGVLLARLFGWPDPRTYGSGHTGGMNISRGAGKTALVIVALADLLKGAAAVWLASRISDNPWALTVGGIMAVVGHNWPVWINFAGGMGLATGCGVMLFHSPVTVVAAAVTLLVVRFLVIKHTPRASITAMAVVPVAMLLLREPAHIFWLGTGAAAIIALRHTADWNRVYD